jgi:NADH-quinone oxidoreductase subunit N
MDALIVVFLTGIVTMFIALAKKPAGVLLTAMTGLIAALVVLIMQWYVPKSIVSYEGLEFDRIAVLYSILAVVLTLLILVGGYAQFRKEPEHTGEYMSLLIFSLVGAMCMFSFTDLFMFFIGLEILSIPIYVMAGTRKGDVLSVEAALKYFFTGSFATGIFLFGTAFLYGATGSFQLNEIQMAIADGSAQGTLLGVGLLIMMASFLFKVGAAPFHFWGPDVYSGSPSIVTGYMAAVVKLAGLFAFMKLFTFVFGEQGYTIWSGALFGLIILTMFVGNLSALAQVRFKRVIAYSSIANAGYALIAVLTQDIASLWNLWVYLLGYGLSIVALLVIAQWVNDDEDRIDAFKGIARRKPFVGVVMITALLSLAGVPPLAGFFGKFMVFSAAFDQYPVLIIIAVINSAIGIYYYLKLVVVALSEPDQEQVTLEPLSFLSIAVLVIAMAGILVGGLLTL